MSIKYKITISITCLIIISLGTIIYYLSFWKYKNALKEEIKKRIEYQLRNINSEISFSVGLIISDKNIESLNLTCRKWFSSLFKENSVISFASFNLLLKNIEVRNFYIREYLFLDYENEEYLLPYFSEIEEKDKKNWLKFLNNPSNNIFYYKIGYDIKKVIEKDYNFLSELLNEIEFNLNKPFSEGQFNINRELYNKTKNFVQVKNNFYQEKLYEPVRTVTDERLIKVFKNFAENLKVIKDNFEIITRAEYKVKGKYNPKIYFKLYNNFLETYFENLKEINRKMGESVELLKNFKEFRIVKADFYLKPDEEIFQKIDLYRFSLPIIIAGKKIGFYEIGISEKEVNKKIMPIILSGIYSSLNFVLLAIFLGMVLSFYVVYPIKKLSYGVDQITKDINYRIKTRRKDEFGKFSNAFNNLADQIIAQLKKYEKLYKEATEDGLTKLIVRRYYLNFVKEELELGKLEGKPTSLLMTDIDHFKKFNDTYGHQTGDLVLAKVAEVILKNIRTNRIRNDIAGRYGGEEFSVLLPNTSKEDALKIAERIREEVEKSFIKTSDGKELKVTISIGVATSEDSNISVEELIERADKALYKSKEQGRNRVSYG